MIDHVVTIGNTSYIGLWCLWHEMHWAEVFMEIRLNDAHQWNIDLWDIGSPWLVA